MRPNIEDEFFAACEPDHDAKCAEGADCRDRYKHIMWAYVPRAMADEIGRLRAEVAA